MEAALANARPLGFNFFDIIETFLANEAIFEGNPFFLATKDAGGNGFFTLSGNRFLTLFFAYLVHKITLLLLWLLRYRERSLCETLSNSS